MAHIMRLAPRTRGTGRSHLPISSRSLLFLSLSRHTHPIPRPINNLTPSQSPTPTSSPITQERTYHSSLQPRPTEHTYTNSQTAILTASLPHIPEHGFSRAALTLGARDAGFLDVSVQLLPRAEFDLILFWLASRRGLLRGRVEEGGLFEKYAAKSGRGPMELGVEEKVKLLIMERIKMNVDVRGKWQDALAQMSLPVHVPLSLTELHALSSDILSLAGDIAVDSAWYTRRLGVAAIYASAELVMTRDNTPDLSETAAFVERRFEDRKALEGKVVALGQCVGFVGSTAVGLGRSWGLKI